MIRRWGPECIQHMREAGFRKRKMTEGGTHGTWGHIFKIKQEVREQQKPGSWPKTHYVMTVVTLKLHIAEARDGQVEWWETLAVSQFRVCVLWRTRPLQSLKASPSETLLTPSAVVKWDLWTISWLPHQMFYTYAKVTMYAMWCRHFFSCFLLFQALKRILGYMRPQRIVDKWFQRCYFKG